MSLNEEGRRSTGGGSGRDPTASRSFTRSTSRDDGWAVVINGIDGPRGALPEVFSGIGEAGIKNQWLAGGKRRDRPDWCRLDSGF